MRQKQVAERTQLTVEVAQEAQPLTGTSAAQAFAAVSARELWLSLVKQSQASNTNYVFGGPA